MNYIEDRDGLELYLMTQLKSQKCKKKTKIHLLDQWCYTKVEDMVKYASLGYMHKVLLKNSKVEKISASGKPNKWLYTMTKELLTFQPGTASYLFDISIRIDDNNSYLVHGYSIDQVYEKAKKVLLSNVDQEALDRVILITEHESETVYKNKKDL